MKQTDSKGLFVQLYEYIWVYYICIWSELFVNELQALRDFSDCPSLMQTQHDTVSARSQMACNYSHHPCILYSLIYVYMKYVNIYIYISYMGSGRFPGPMELLLQQLVRVSKTRWRWFNLNKSMLLQPLIKKLEVLVMINQWTTYCINDNNDERWMVVLEDFYLTFCKN